MVAPTPGTAASRMLPFAGFGMGFGVGAGCGAGIGFGVGGNELTKVPGFGGFGGCGIGAGFGYGWFIAGLGVPIRRMTDELGITEKRIWKRYNEHESETKGKANLTGPSSGTQMHGAADGGRMPCEQVEDEDTILDERLKEVMISIERRRQDIQQRREALLKLMQQQHTK